MKKKNLKKIIKSSFEELMSLKDNQNQATFISTDSFGSITYEEKRNPYDEKQSQRFLKMVIGLMEQDETNVSMMSSGTVNIHQNLQNGEELQIVVTQQGYKINKWKPNTIGSGLSLGTFPIKPVPNHCYSDETILEKITPIVRKKMEDFQQNAFNDLIDDIYVLTKLSRDNNLEEILKDENNDNKC